MKYSQTKEALKVVMSSGDVPVLIGTAGIGKTSMIQEIANENDMLMFVLEGNLLKEGEVGGLPYLDDSFDARTLKNNLYKIIKDEEESPKQKTIKCYNTMDEMRNSKQVKYAPFHTIKTIINISKENPKQKIILFIDELNRCSNEVLQELMNIILQRNINGFKIPENVFIVCAMNPSSKNQNFKDTEYSVLEMDTAQADRLVFLELDCDVSEWISWGNKTVGQAYTSLIDGKSNLEMEDSVIHTDILEFIATYPDSLNVTVNTSTDDKSPTPRAWERVSHSYYLYKNGFYDNQDILYNIIKGNVGASKAVEFINFTREKVKKIIPPEEVFAKENLIKDVSEDLPAEIKEYVENESPIRLLVFNERLLRYLEGKTISANECVTYIKIMHSFPTDMINSIYHDIQIRKVLAVDGTERQSKLWKKFMDIPAFVEGFISLEEKIRELSRED